jgi:hypothetical protein
MRLVALLALALAGCELIVGDIQLPAKVIDGGSDATGLDAAPADAMAEAGPDGRVADAAPTDAVGADATSDGAVADAAPPDAADLDMTVDATPPDAAPPDAARPDAGSPQPPPIDVRALAGDWHLYGLVTDGTGGTSAFSAYLRLADGRASLFGFDGALLNRNTPFAADPDAPDRVQTNLFPKVGLMTGRFDAASGFGVLVNDAQSGLAWPATVFAVRASNPPVTPVPNVVYGRAGVDPTDAEIGFLAWQSSLTESSRFGVGVQNGLPDRTLDAVTDGLPRAHFQNVDGAPDEERDGTVLPSGAGLVALVETAGTPTGIVAGLASAAGEVRVRSGRFWCGGLYRDAAGAPVTLSLYGSLSDDSIFAWDDGRIGALNVQGSIYAMLGDRGPFDSPGGIAVVDRRSRIYVMMPVYSVPGQLEVRWGLAACLPVDGGALPEVPAN